MKENTKFVTVCVCVCVCARVCVCMCVCAKVHRYQSIQTGLCFRRAEVGQLVAREPHLGVAHVTQISCFSCLSACVITLLHLSIEDYTFLRINEDIGFENISVDKQFPAVTCSLVVRMQQLTMKVLSSTLLLLALVHSVYSETDCSQAESCDLCVGESTLNLTGCVWRLCPDGNNTGVCVKDDSTDRAMNCSWTNVAETCTGDGGKTGSSPEFSQAKFDMSSFIGGIILVLCLQAAGFFAMRFLKSKEQSNYDPIDQPQ
ncbi:uncharacterized protein cd164l2 isoform X2 [Channa argus]|uniref:uncharacterized protein cd164l2 isoform X2 n=1 Tax=Channa argus TaxID=215402 RepID=UPI0035203421